MGAKFANNAVGTLAIAISDNDTLITVSGDEGQRFPTLLPGDYFYATLVDADGNREIVKVTARVGNTMTVERGQDGTTPRSFDTGSKVSHRLTAGMLNEFVAIHEQQAKDFTDFKTDVAGDLVTGGTASAYTLTTAQTFNSLVDGIFVTARMHVENAENPTFRLNTLDPKPIRTVYGTNIPEGALAAGGVYSFVYNSTDDAWIVHGRFADTMTKGEHPDLLAIEAIEGTSGALKKTGANQWTLDDLTTSINFIRDTGNANVSLSPGVLGDVQVDFSCVITGVVLLANTNGSCVVDIWKNTFNNFPPTDEDSITGDSRPTLSNTNKYSDTTLSGWTTNIAAGDILRFNLVSVSNISRILIKLRVKRFG